MTDTVLRTEPEPGIALVTLNRPDRLNAMSTELVADLHVVLGAIADDPSVRVVVLTGEGRGFCAGLDLKESSQRTAAGEGRGGRAAAGMAGQQQIASLVPRLRGLRQPVIAAVNGAASGGGLALALASDVRVAAASARFNVAFIRVGLSGCDIGVSWLLPRLIGASAAFELLLTGPPDRRRGGPAHRAWWAGSCPTARWSRRRWTSPARSPPTARWACG